MKNKIKNFLSFILGIVMMFSVIVMIISFFIKFTLLKPNTYIKEFKNQKVQVDIQETIERNIGYILTVNNLPIEVKENIITTDDVQNDVTDLLTSIVTYFKTGENNITNVNTDKYMDNYRANIKKFIRDNSINITPKLSKELAGLEKDCKQIITNELELVNLDSIKDSVTIEKITKITSLFSSKLYLLSLVPPIICMLILLVIWKKDYAKYMQWIGNGFLTAGLCIFLLFLSGYISHFYDNIIINTEYLKSYIGIIIKGYLVNLIFLGLISMYVGIMLLIPQIKHAMKITKSRILEKEI